LADDQVAQVKQANDIVDVINEYLPLRKVGRNFLGRCPFHDDQRPSLTVNPVKQLWRCWPCQIGGDVFEFVMRKEKMDFREALEMLARRANITLQRGRPSSGPSKAQMYEVMKWAEQEYHRHFLDSPGAVEARKYLKERHFTPETIKQSGLGYAPASWDWLYPRAKKAKWSDELLVLVGLVRQRESDSKFYDCFRDRVLFPIRDVRGRTIAFGGRILPTASPSPDIPKYYNSIATPLFNKSEHLYGLDQARAAGEKEGFLAVVEGYTDVLMAHQLGILPVVAPLGTALNERHISQLRKFVPKVVLVFDADTGGNTGVDRALELFISQEVELAIATLPAEMDPCDLLEREGPEAFRAVLASAVDALDFKLSRVLTAQALATVEGRRRAIDDLLRILARVPETPSKVTAVKRDAAIAMVAHRSGVDEAHVRRRLAELRPSERSVSRDLERTAAAEEPAIKADPLERELLEVLLADPRLVAKARHVVDESLLEHPGTRRVLAEMYSLLDAGESPDVDHLRVRLAESPRLLETVAARQAAGLQVTNRSAWLEAILVRFQERAEEERRHEVRSQLKNVPSHGPPPLELLRKLQSQAART
jgi:DNA primase